MIVKAVTFCLTCSDVCSINLKFSGLTLFCVSVQTSQTQSSIEYLFDVLVMLERNLLNK